MDREEQWIEAARKDPEAFAPLYEHYVQQIYRYCYRQTGDPDVSDDLTAVVFVRALERLEQYRSREDATFRSWLFAIARNAVRDRWRRQRFVRPKEPTLAEVVDDAPGPEDIAVHRSDMEKLRHALGVLPSTQRDIIELRIAGLTVSEIGVVLDLSMSAVKSAQTRAYNQLRQVLRAERGASS